MSEVAEIKSDYKGFGEHVQDYNEAGIPLSIGDLKKLAIKYNTPVPSLDEEGKLKFE